MTDFDGTAYYASTGGPEASEPSGSSTPSEGSQKAIAMVKEQAFDAIANDKSSTDATDYVEERKDQMAEEAGETISPQRKQARSERLQRALATARESGDGPGGREPSNAIDYQEAREAAESGEDFESQQRRRDESVRVPTHGAGHSRASGERGIMSAVTQMLLFSYGGAPYIATPVSLGGGTGTIGAASMTITTR